MERRWAAVTVRGLAGAAQAELDRIAEQKSKSVVRARLPFAETAPSASSPPTQQPKHTRVYLLQCPSSQPLNPWFSGA
jgi:hypothetical protein